MTQAFCLGYDGAPRWGTERCDPNGSDYAGMESGDEIYVQG